MNPLRILLALSGDAYVVAVCWVAIPIVLLLGGCDGMEPEWQVAPRNYACTSEQMAKVQSEAKWCADNTHYYATYCYGTAIMRNCQKGTK